MQEFIIINGYLKKEERSQINNQKINQMKIQPIQVLGYQQSRTQREIYSIKVPKLEKKFLKSMSSASTLKI